MTTIQDFLRTHSLPRIRASGHSKDDDIPFSAWASLFLHGRRESDPASAFERQLPVTIPISFDTPDMYGFLRDLLQQRLVAEYPCKEVMELNGALKTLVEAWKARDVGDLRDLMRSTILSLSQAVAEHHATDNLALEWTPGRHIAPPTVFFQRDVRTLTMLLLSNGVTLDSGLAVPPLDGGLPDLAIRCLDTTGWLLNVKHPNDFSDDELTDLVAALQSNCIEMFAKNPDGGPFDPAKVEVVFTCSEMYKVTRKVQCLLVEIFHQMVTNQCPRLALATWGAYCLFRIDNEGRLRASPPILNDRSRREAYGSSALDLTPLELLTALCLHTVQLRRHRMEDDYDSIVPDEWLSDDIVRFEAQEGMTTQSLALRLPVERGHGALLLASDVDRWRRAPPKRIREEAELDEEEVELDEDEEQQPRTVIRVRFSDAAAYRRFMTGVP